MIFCLSERNEKIQWRCLKHRVIVIVKKLYSELQDKYCSEAYVGYVPVTILGQVFFKRDEENGQNIYEKRCFGILCKPNKMLSCFFAGGKALYE